MAELKDLIQSGDWKKEKHVPVIDVAGAAKKGESVKITVTVGKEMPHPNTTEHHIGWITVFFLPDGEKFALQIARCEFAAHGASAQGPDTSTIYSSPEATVAMKTDKPGTIMATSYCNIHGLWSSSKALEVA